MKPALAVILLLICGAAFAAPPPMPRKAERAYALLSADDQTFFNLHVTQVKAALPEGAYLPGTIQLKDTLDADLSWIAAMLIHEAEHLARGHQTCTRAQELETMPHTIKVLRYTGGDPWDIKFLETTDGSWCDT